MKTITTTRSPEAIAAKLGVPVAVVRAAVDTLKIQPEVVRAVSRFSPAQIDAISHIISMSSSPRRPSVCTCNITGTKRTPRATRTSA